MRARALGVLVSAAALTSLTGCDRPPTALAPQPLPFFSLTRLPATAPPSPLGLKVRVGRVQALIPASWQAEPLPQSPYQREGFVAGPRINDWEHGPATVRGAEAFWIDVGDVSIPSDYYYLVARGPALGGLAAAKSCRQLKQRVLLDHRPDLTGETDSPGDYVASGTGVCHTHGKVIRWEYIVVAPGFGPIRRIGIPTSGLYVVIAAASGRDSAILVQKMIDGTRFSNTPISTFIEAASHLS